MDTIAAEHLALLDRLGTGDNPHSRRTLKDHLTRLSKDKSARGATEEHRIQLPFELVDAPPYCGLTDAQSARRPG